MSMLFPAITEFELKLPVYLAGIGCHHIQEHVVRPKGYPYLQWIQCRNGTGELLLEDSCIIVGKNQGMLLFSDMPHEYYAASEEWEVDWITIGGYAAEQILKNAGFSKSEVFFVSDPELILLRTEKLLKLAASYSTISSLECSKILYSIILDILSHTSIDKIDYMENQFIKLKPVFEYIEKHFQNLITLEILSDIAGLTPQYFCTIFKKMTGIRVFEYINSIRIKNSKEMLLKCRDFNLKDVAKQCGFQDVSYFCSLFKKSEKITPSEFRKLHGV